MESARNIATLLESAAHAQSLNAYQQTIDMAIAESPVEYVPLLENVIHSATVDSVLKHLFLNGVVARTRDTPNASFVPLPRHVVAKAKSDFDQQYAQLEQVTYQTVHAIVTDLIGEDHTIELLRTGLVGYFEDDLVKGGFKVDMTGQWEKIIATSDEDLAYEQPRFENPAGQFFRPQKSYLLFKPQATAQPQFDGLDFISSRMKGKNLGLEKTVRTLYQMVFPADGVILPKINNNYGINDFGGLRLVTENIDQSYELRDQFEQGLGGIEVLQVKDYISNPKSNGYQSLHLIAQFEGYLMEIQIRDKSMHRKAEKGVASRYGSAFATSKVSEHQRLIQESGNAYAHALVEGNLLYAQERKIIVI